MGRIRTIKPEFFKHSALYDSEVETGLPLRIAFAGLWTCCDREGRFKWKPRELKLEILPYDPCNFSAVLEALKEFGFVEQYKIKNEVYGHVPSFLEHQVINQREAQSRIPAPGTEAHMQARAESDMPRTCTHVQAHGEGKGREGKGVKGGDSEKPSPPLTPESSEPVRNPDNPAQIANLKAQGAENQTGSQTGGKKKLHILPPRTKEMDEALREVFDFYVKATDRKPNLNTLTRERRELGQARLQEALHKTGGDMRKAVELMKAAIAEAAMDDYQMGRTAKTGYRKLANWDRDIFKNAGQFEEWTERYQEAALREDHSA